MITTETKALSLAEKMVKQFAEEHKDTMAQNRKKGDTLGMMEGTPIHHELDKLRTEYIKQVEPAIARTTNYFNIAVVRYVLRKNR